MNKVFKYFIPCMAVALGLTSCYDEQDSKATIDGRYEKATNTVVSIASAEAADYQSITIVGALTDTIDVVEQGFQLSSTNDFSEAAFQPMSRDALTFTLQKGGLDGSTTYYARAYVVTSGSGVAFSEPVAVTTPRAPIFDINTTFLVHEYAYSSGKWVTQIDDETGEDVGYFLMNIEFAEGSETDVIITGFCGYPASIVGVWNPETSTVTIPDGQIIGAHPAYGDMYPKAFDFSIADYAEDGIITLTFKSLGGILTSTPYTLSVDLGYFGIYCFEAVPYLEEE